MGRGGIYADRLLLFCCIILSMQYKVASITSVWTYIHVGVWWLSLIGFVCFIFVYSQFIGIPEWYKLPEFVFGQAVFWLAILLVPLAIAVMDYVVERVAASVSPSSQDRLMAVVEKEQADDELEILQSTLSFAFENTEDLPRKSQQHLEGQTVKHVSL